MLIPRAVAAGAIPVVTAAVLRLWDLAAVGFGNQYYAATVKSMTTSLAAFLYGSFDPQLYVSVDKPAPGLWPQAIAAKVFGFSNLALLLPEAIAGVVSVAVLFRIVARAHGILAGAIAALALAVAPVAVAVDRNNTMDADLVLVLLVAVWCALRSLESGARWLLVAGVLVGVGFEIKMSQAYLVAPAIAIAYLIASPTRPLARFLPVVGFSAMALAVSALWIAFVDLTPADARPYVGSSANNTALELALGHNGFARLPQEMLFWRRSGPGVGGPPPNPQPVSPGQPGPPITQPAPPALPPGPSPTDEAGERGPLRLFNQQLAGQVSWYVPLALVGAIAVLVRDGRRATLTRGQASVLLWLLWLLPAAVLFSWSGIFHRYYLVMLAPPLAALVGAGCAALAALARTALAWRVVVTLVALATASLHIAIVMRTGDFARWLVPAAALGAAACVVALLPLRVGQRAAAAFALASVFAAPVVWAGTTLAAFDAGLPYAGPDLLPFQRNVARPPTVPAGSQPILLLDFLLSERRGERWIAAMSSENTAAMLMLRADVAVMALGGFSGTDPILTPSAIEAKVRSGELRFVVIEDRMQAELGSWVRTRCLEVPAIRFAPSPVPPGRPGPAPPAVFDCARVRQAP